MNILCRCTQIYLRYKPWDNIYLCKCYVGAYNPCTVNLHRRAPYIHVNTMSGHAFTLDVNRGAPYFHANTGEHSYALDVNREAQYFQAHAMSGHTYRPILDVNNGAPCVPIIPTTYYAEAYIYFGCKLHGTIYLWSYYVGAHIYVRCTPHGTIYSCSY